MRNDLVGALLAFAVGVGLAGAGFLLGRRVLQKKPEGYVVFQSIKQIVQILFLAALLILGPHTSWDTVWLLAGGCLGVTLPLLWFTPKLVRLNGALHEKPEKEDRDDG